MNDTETITAAVSTVAAVVAVLVAGWSIFEGRRLYKLQTSPDIVVYLKRNAGVQKAVDLIVANLGSAAASEVKFIFPPYCNLFVLYEGQRQKIHIIDNGVQFFPPGERYAYSIGEFPKMDKSEVPVTVSFRRHGTRRNERVVTQKFLLRPLELEGQAEWTNHEREAQISLKKTMDAFRDGEISLS